MPERYEDENEEILKKSGADFKGPKKLGTPKLSLNRLLWLNVKQSLGGKIWGISPQRVMLFAVSLILAALVFRFFVPGLVAPFGFAGLLLFIVGYGMVFVQPRGVEKRWRGQPLDTPRESWLDKLRRRFNKR